ncbi:hypothetical protein GCM10025882_34530 [Acinetobacter gyllenbergii]|nr:hypothetical protein GCM10025882_34530 [Acinetobacter gyllenbergii]
MPELSLKTDLYPQHHPSQSIGYDGFLAHVLIGERNYSKYAALNKKELIVMDRKKID